MNFPFQKNVIDEIGTEQLALEFAELIEPGDLIVINGDLGSGKTFFVKKAVSKFGIHNASSPTFSLVNEYSGKYKIYHFDFYRINKMTELLDIGINDYLNDEKAIIFIEWGSMFPNIIPHQRIEVTITIKENFSREFNFKKYD